MRPADRARPRGPWTSTVPNRHRRSNTTPRRTAARRTGRRDAASRAPFPEAPEAVVSRQRDSDDDAWNNADGEHEHTRLPFGRERQRPVGADLAGPSQELFLLGHPAEGVHE